MKANNGLTHAAIYSSICSNIITTPPRNGRLTDTAMYQELATESGLKVKQVKSI